MTLKEFYLKYYPTDELGKEIEGMATFSGLLNSLFLGLDVYGYIGVGDSIVRERLFEKLSEELNEDYNYIYDLWLGKYYLAKKTNR